MSEDPTKPPWWRFLARRRWNREQLEWTIRINNAKAINHV